MLINDFEFVVDKVMKVANQIVVIGKVTDSVKFSSQFRI